MMNGLLDKSTLSLYNRQLKYPLAIAEKDYFLAIVCGILFSSHLQSKLIFKGGTAIYHTYLPQLRFSEDLDFSTNQSVLEPEEIVTILSQTPYLNIKKDFRSQMTYKIERLIYKGPLEYSNSLKVEFDLHQNVVLPPKEMKYHNQYGLNIKVMVMDIKEIIAEKIRAMNDRIRYRDFYDYAMINKKLEINLTESIDLMQKKEIRKTISPKTIMENWQLAQKERNNELQAIYYSEDLDNEEIKHFLSKLDFSEICE